MWTLTILEARETVPTTPCVPETRIWRENDGTIAAYSYTFEDRCWMHFPGSARYCFEQNSRQITAIADHNISLHYLWDTYYRSVLPLVMQVQGYEVLHASAVKVKQGIAAFCGVSESGKSTFAYALEQHGYSLWADDGVAFEVQEDRMMALPLPFRVRLRPASAAYFGPVESKDDVRLDSRSYEAIALPPQPLTAVCILERLQSENNAPVVEVMPLSPGHAFTSVLPHAYCYSLDDLDRKKTMIEHYFELAGCVPVYLIKYKSGLHHLDQILNEIIRKID